MTTEGLKAAEARIKEAEAVLKEAKLSFDEMYSASLDRQYALLQELFREGALCESFLANELRLGPKTVMRIRGDLDRNSGKAA
jgi:hypothetical protein